MSKIEWVKNEDGTPGKTWNPVTGCTKVSPGCKNCYAEGIAKRFWGDRKFTDIQFHADRLDQPLKWKKPSKIFICSMGDLFHENIKYSDINSIFLKMLEYDWHTYIILTKRPERMKEFISIGTGWRGTMKHVWLGVTAENQEMADKRIPVLLQIPAAVRFVSIEPMLGLVEINKYLVAYCSVHDFPSGFCIGTCQAKIPSLDWVICGAESGSKRRHPNPMWGINLKNQCVYSGTPFFLKQWEIDRKLVKMPELDGRVWGEMP